MTDLFIATGNRGKLAEFKALLTPLGFRISSPADFQSLPTVEETEMTFEGNAKLKARTLAQYLNRWTLADDSGLEVAALDGRPGVHTARYAGVGATNAENRRKLLLEMAQVGPESRQAHFVAVIVLSSPDGKCVAVRGTCPGTIALSEKGDGGFGYDPVFMPQGYDQTMAEIDGATKNRISHRGRALEKLLPVLQALRENSE